MKNSLIAFFLLISLNSFGTAQIPDRLIYKGDTISLFSLPLNSSPIKESLSPMNLFGSKGCFYTACWRNYMATWAIDDDKLYLVSIRNACYPTDMKYVAASYKGKTDSIGTEYADLETLFPHKVRNGRVLADWVDAVMFAPKGKLLYYVHDGFESIFEKEFELTIRGGKLLQTSELNNYKLKKSKYAENPELCLKFIQSQINYSTLPKSDQPFTVYINMLNVNEEGKIDSVKVLRGHGEIYDQEAMRVIKLIPNWDVLYQHGKRIKSYWMFPVRFDWTNEKKQTP